MLRSSPNSPQSGNPPAYALYGEADGPVPHMHIERISDRAPSSDWHISLHHHPALTQYILVGQGSVDVTINNTESTLSGPAIVAVPAGCVHAFVFQTETQGYVLSICHEDNHLWSSTGERPDVAISGNCETAAIFAGDTLHTIRRRSSPAAEALQIALIAQIRAHAQLLFEEQGKALRQTPGLKLVQEFETLIDRRLHERWSATRYASELRISPAHLNRVTRSITGCKASHLIAMATVRRAKSMLIYTDQTISEVAYALGYDDPPHFSRRFKQWTGHSPSAFRNKIR